MHVLRRMRRSKFTKLADELVGEKSCGLWLSISDKRLGGNGRHWLSERGGSATPRSFRSSGSGSECAQKRHTYYKEPPGNNRSAIRL